MSDYNYRVSAILLAGGVGSRMCSDIPKQYLELGGKVIVRYAFDCLCMVPEVSEIIVVCDREYRELFDDALPDVDISFAAPGRRRQDSVFNGCQAILSKPDLICVHDGARPFITAPMVKHVLDAAFECGAATAAMPVKFTVKEADDKQCVVNTPDRSRIWEIQTPQALKPEVIREGFDYVNSRDLTVTDDVSLAEQLGYPVKLVEGDYDNLKITTPEDLIIAEEILKRRISRELVCR